MPVDQNALLTQLRVLSNDESILKRIFFQLSDASYIDQEKNRSEIVSKITGLSFPLTQLMMNLTENVFIPQNLDIAVYHHLRYLPPLMHSHDFIEINCMLEGTGFYYCEDERLTMAAGDVVIVPPKINHAIYVNNDAGVLVNFLVRVSTFDVAFIHLLQDKNILADFFMHIIYGGAPSPYILFPNSPAGTQLSIGLEMFIEYISDRPYKRWMMNAQLSQFFVALLREHEQDVIVPHTSTKDSGGKIVPILNFMQQEFASITLPALAEHFNYSPRQISRILKEHTGQSFSELIRGYKISKAKFLLEHDDVAVSEIVEQTGFADMSHFYRTFSKVCGCTPSEYRKRLAR